MFYSGRAQLMARIQKPHPWKNVALLLGITVVACPGKPHVDHDPTPEDVPMVLGGMVCNLLSESCCADMLFQFTGGCLNKVEGPIETSVELAIEQGLTYSLECIERTISESSICPMISTSGRLLPCEIDCQIYFGDVAAGEPCEAIGYRMSDCQQGLVCGPDRVCQDSCDVSLVAPEGGFCGPARGMWFVECDAGLACGAEGTCELAQPLGAACDSTTPCATGTWCAPGADSCTAAVPEGSSCTVDDECPSRACRDGWCFEPESPECGRWAW
jgi:hypothetical protein